MTPGRVAGSTWFLWLGIFALTACTAENAGEIAGEDARFRGGPLVGDIAFEALEELAENTKDRWVRSDARGVAESLVADRIHLSFEEVDGDGLRYDQAVRVLREWFDRYRVIRAETERVFIARQNPSTGFFEIDWRVVARGTTEVLQYSVFFGCEIVDNRWRISRISMLEPAV